MKRKLVNGLSLFFVLLMGYSCSSSPSQDYLNEYEVRRMIEDAIRQNNEQLEFTYWKIVNVEVQPTHWGLVENESETFYEATAELDELTEFIFDEGAALGYYKFDDNAKTALPFVKTTIGVDGIPYTETYSCDFQLGNPSTVTFYLEGSDAGRYDGNPPAANFQVVLIW
ncbi:MAG: hypothetical protein Q4G48_01400 [Bacteroidia bacterium]|nr:hypothetical protein [Bacteroidia bacterium]